MSSSELGAPPDLKIYCGLKFMGVTLTLTSSVLLLTACVSDYWMLVPSLSAKVGLFRACFPNGCVSLTDNTEPAIGLLFTVFLSGLLLPFPCGIIEFAKARQGRLGCQKCIAGLSFLMGQLCPYLSLDTRRTVVQALLTSLLDYCNSAFAGSPCSLGPLAVQVTRKAVLAAQFGWHEMYTLMPSTPEDIGYILSTWAQAQDTGILGIAGMAHGTVLLREFVAEHSFRYSWSFAIGWLGVIGAIATGGLSVYIDWVEPKTPSPETDTATQHVAAWQPQQPAWQPQPPAWQPQQGLMQPQQFTWQPNQGVTQPQQTTWQPPHGVMQPQPEAWQPPQPQQTAWQPQQGEIQPQQTAFPPQQGEQQPQQTPWQPQQE